MRRSTRMMMMQHANRDPEMREWDEHKYGRGNEYSRMGGYDSYEEPEMRRRRGNDGRYMRSDYDRQMTGGMNTGMYSNAYSGDRMIGFDRDGMNWTRRMSSDWDRPMGYSGMSEDMPSSNMGNIYATGAIWTSPSNGGMMQPVTEVTAQKWVREFRNADGTTGPHFKMDQAEQYRNTNCPHCDKWEFYVAMNMMYSDYYEIAKKYGMDKPDFYAHMAKAFLDDPDAGDHKLSKYMECVVH